MKILVTGANGYLGRGVVKKLIDIGHDVIATDITTDNVEERAEKINSNIFSLENAWEFLGKPDCLVHLAWRDGFVHYSDSHIADLPRHYTFIKSFADKVNKIVVMGSMHEIGFYEGSIDETTPCHPITPYGIAKNALRDLTQGICQKNNITMQWLRGYYIVSNSECGNSIFSKIVRCEAEGKYEFPFTMGQNQYDFLDYEDFCGQVAATISQDSVNGIINICSGRPEKLADRVERFIKENNFKIKLKYGAFPDRPYDSKAVWGNSSKIDKILGI